MKIILTSSQSDTIDLYHSLNPYLKGFLSPHQLITPTSSQNENTNSSSSSSDIELTNEQLKLIIYLSFISKGSTIITEENVEHARNVHENDANLETNLQRITTLGFFQIQNNLHTASVKDETQSATVAPSSSSSDSTKAIKPKNKRVRTKKNSQTHDADRAVKAKTGKNVDRIGELEKENVGLKNILNQYEKTIATNTFLIAFMQNTSQAQQAEIIQLTSLVNILTAPTVPPILNPMPINFDPRRPLGILSATNMIPAQTTQPGLQQNTNITSTPPTIAYLHKFN